MNTLKSIPLETKYLIFESLNPIDIIRVIKAIGVDLGELYWARRHRREFASALKEIDAIVYSINSKCHLAYKEGISAVKIGYYSSSITVNGYRTCYFHHEIFPHRHFAVTDLSATSNKKLRDIDCVENSRRIHKIYKQDLSDGYTLSRHVDVGYFEHLLHSNVSGTTIDSDKHNPTPIYFDEVELFD